MSPPPIDRERSTSAFVNHWADGDLLIVGRDGSTLIDVKTVAKTSDVNRSIRWLWQVILYAWLDGSDRYRIRRAGLYLARHGVLLTWPLDELTRALLGNRDPQEARADFATVIRRVVAAEGASSTITDLPDVPGGQESPYASPRTTDG